MPSSSPGHMDKITPVSFFSSFDLMRFNKDI